MTDTSKIQEMREAFERTNSRDHRRQPPKGNNYIDPMAQADWESFQKGWQASRQAVVVELPAHGASMFSAGVEQCKAAIEACGLRVRVMP